MWQADGMTSYAISAFLVGITHGMYHPGFELALDQRGSGGAEDHGIRSGALGCKSRICLWHGGWWTVG